MSVFFTFQKTVFKSLLDTSSTPGYLSSFQAFSYRNLDTFSTPSESIKKVRGPSIAPRQLLDRSRFCSCVVSLFLDTFLIASSVDVLFPRHLPRQMARHLSTPYLSRFIEDLFKLPRVIRSLFLSIFLSIALYFLS